MATVHTAYGPGEIVDKETVRGRTQYKVAGDGFEVWLDETKIASMDGEELSQSIVPGGWAADDERHAPIFEEEFVDHPMVENRSLQRELDRRRMHDMDYGDDPYLRESSVRQGWAPLDKDNSTRLPYNPAPQHDAIDGPGFDDGSSTIQPIHHIDADERLSPADSVSFDSDEDEDCCEPGPDPELFAKHAIVDSVLVNTIDNPTTRKIVDRFVPKRFRPTEIVDGARGTISGAGAAHAVNSVGRQVDKAVDMVSPGFGWGDLIKPASRHEANPALALAPALLRTLGPAAARAVAGNALADAASEASDFSAGEGWGDLVKDAYARPAGLSDKYIDITAGADYHNDPAAQFRHDPDAYINRIGHLMDEGLNPRFAEYMDLVEADNSIRTAAWKDVRKKAMRLKREGHVTVKDIAPNRIMASVVGDHGTYDVVILKAGSFGGLQEGNPGHSISNWHCGCEWGKWAFRRKFTYVGRLCSHAYASYLTMQSAHMKGKPRQQKGPKRKAPARSLPFLHVKRGNLHTADNLQNGPTRLTPELVVNDADDAHMFLDVTKDERDDVGPDDVVSEKDIVHFARVMRHCEANERPYPRELVAFLARYAGCADDAGDDTQDDYQAHDATDANEYLEKIRSDADRKQEKDFGSMAERVRKIQDAVEEAHEHGADASRFVAMRKTAEPSTGDPGLDAYLEKGGVGYTENANQPGTYNFNRTKGDGKKRETGGDPGSKAYAENGGIRYQENADQPGTYSFQRTSPTVNNDGGGDQKKEENSVKPAGPGDPRLDAYGPDGINKNNPGGSNGPHGGVGDRVRSNPETMPAIGPNSTADKTQGKGTGNGAGGNAGTGQSGAGGQGGNANQGGNAGAGGKGGASAGGAGSNTNPGGGQTSGPVADGGKAGAESGNNEAITKNSPNVDANGMYTVQQGDTWTDIAQRATGDMNNYQKMYDAQGGAAGGNIDSLAAGTQINLKDFLNDVGNKGVSGDVTNPADGGPDGNKSTQDFEIGLTSPSGNTLSTAQGFAGGAPKVDTSAAEGAGGVGGVGGATSAAASPADSTTTKQDGSTNPIQPKASKGSASWWLQRFAAPSATNPANPSDPNAGQDGTTNTTAPTTPAASPGAGVATTPATPGGTTPPVTAQPGGTNKNQVGPSRDADTYDPEQSEQLGTGEGRNDGTQTPQQQQDQSMMSSGAGMTGMDALSTGLGVAGDIASGIGSAIPDMASGLSSAIPNIADAASSIASGIGSIFASKSDFDEFVRYAYPQVEGEGDLEPHTHPFAGSGYPGPLEFGTSEEYADKARRKADDVTDLGDDPLSTPMGKWQRQSSTESYEEWVRNNPEEKARIERELAGEWSKGHAKAMMPKDGDWGTPGYEDDDPYREASIGYSTDDDSDIVRTFQAHLGQTALGEGAGSGAGRFDDIAGAAQGFLRTAGRNYSLAEQSELIREGDKGGARNLDSLDLKGTHYEDMHTLGW